MKLGFLCSQGTPTHTNKKMVRVVNKSTKKSTKNTNTLTTDDVAKMLCKLGLGLAQHFEIDESEVIEYLDGVCEDTVGVNPDSAAVFNEIKELDDDPEEDENVDGEVLSITQSEFDEWFAKPGLSLKVLRKKALEYGIEPEGLKKSDLKIAFEELVIPDDDDEEDDEEGLDSETIEAWFQPISKGGLKLKELREKAEEYSIDTKGLKRTELKESFMALIMEEEEEDDEEEEDSGELDEDTINEWFQTPAKGGLKLGELKEKAEQFGIDSKGLKKKDIKEALLALCNGEEEEVDDDEEESVSDSSELSKDQVLIWCLPPGKGGLKLSELKEKAEEFGIDSKGLKKTDLKEALFALCEGESEEDEESDAEDETFACYMEADGAKGKKFWSCKVEGCELTTSFGSVGKDGKDTTRELASNEKAIAQANKLVQQKVAKGYEEVKANKKKALGKVKSSISGKCHYKNRDGKECTIKPKGSAKFCAKHSTGQKKSNNTPAIYRDKKAKVWMVEGEKLIVKSPNNPTVYAFLTKKGEVNKKLTKALKNQATKLGLEVAE